MHSNEIIERCFNKKYSKSNRMKRIFIFKETRAKPSKRGIKKRPFYLIKDNRRLIKANQIKLPTNYLHKHGRQIPNLPPPPAHSLPSLKKMKKKRESVNTREIQFARACETLHKIPCTYVSS